MSLVAAFGQTLACSYSKYLYIYIYIYVLLISPKVPWDSIDRHWIGAFCLPKPFLISTFSKHGTSSPDSRQWDLSQPGYLQPEDDVALLRDDQFFGYHSIAPHTALKSLETTCDLTGRFAHSPYMDTYMIGAPDLHTVEEYCRGTCSFPTGLLPNGTYHFQPEYQIFCR